MQLLWGCCALSGTDKEEVAKEAFVWLLPDRDDITCRAFCSEREFSGKDLDDFEFYKRK